jgi:repressor LexA
MGARETTVSTGGEEPALEAGADLTDKQHQVLAFVERQIRQVGYAPTIREIGKQFGIRSTNGVNDHLVALEKKGYLTRDGQKSRTLRVLRSIEGPLPAKSVRPSRDNVLTLPSPFGRSDDLVEIPLLGRVAAGVPLLAEQNIEDTVRVSSFLLGRGTNAHKVFALRVVGESMIDDGIFDGDFLFVKKQAEARSGEIVVAMIEGEATVKRFFPEGDRIRFQPANARMEPLFVWKSEFRQTDILGVVVGVYRRM